MSLVHAQAAEVVDVRPLGALIEGTRTHTLFKTPSLEVIRLVLLAGRALPTHRAPGEIVVQCLEGKVEFTAGDEPRWLRAGELLYLDAGAPHSLIAAEDSSLLVTLLLPRHAGALR